MSVSIRSFNADVTRSLDEAAKCHKALDAGLRELRDACAAGRWGGIEDIRSKCVAAVDGYVDHYAAACRGLEAEGLGL